MFSSRYPRNGSAADSRREVSMSRYSGLFLSFLLIFICLWININRCPQVWKMVNGSEFPAPGEKAAPTDDSNTLETEASPAGTEPFYARIAEEGENWPKPVVISASYSPAEAGESESSAEEGSSEEEGSVYQKVSLTADQCSAEAVSEAVRAEEPAAAPSDVISDVSEGGIRVHSSYLAAEFSEESSPLDHAAPSYRIESNPSNE